MEAGSVFGIEIQASTSGKTDQLETSDSGRLYSKRRWRTDGNESSETGCPRLLGDLKRSTSTHPEPKPSGRQEVVEVEVTDHFVDRVVPADVLTLHYWNSSPIKGNSSVDGSRCPEQRLVNTYAIGKSCKEVEVEWLNFEGF
jgi:hypothetical protein|tara:strand:- start:23481 stop:23906 length:426 start_codon:yes stop_codon:yes gene_type:complete